MPPNIIAIMVMRMELDIFIRPPVESRSLSDSMSLTIVNPLRDTSRIPPRLTPLCENGAITAAVRNPSVIPGIAGTLSAMESITTIGGRSSIGLTLKELLMSAEYIMNEGNENILLCERGIRTYESYTRNTLDLSAVPVLHELSHLPVIVDPSHATGSSSLVPSMAVAAAACGTDGLMIEVHNNPAKALCDGAQSLTPAAFADVMEAVNLIRPHAFKG